MNLIGFVQALLINVAAIAGINDPQLKVTPTGFLQMLLENGANTQVVNADALRRGAERTMKVRYMQRGLESDVDDTDDCDTPITPAWKEAEIQRSLFSKIGIFIDDDTMRKLQTEAANVTSVGQPATPMFMALYQTMLVKLNGLIQKINTDLLTAQATAWGTNVAYGAATAQTLDFGGKMTMDNGIVKLILDAQANEIAGNVVIVGNGVVNAFQVLNSMKTGVDAQGYPRANFNVYNDFKSSAVWGANHFGVFAQGLSAFVDFNKNVGTFAGERGGSYFFTIPVPMQLAGGTLSTLVLDAQLKYVDCPVVDTGGVKIADRGWKLILSKPYGLWNSPNDMFAAGDRMAGFNGSLHYIGAAAPDCVTVCP
jgi:hypothetical protein